MYKPLFKCKKNSVPVLSRKEIDHIGEQYVREFQPNVLTNPEPVDIESFAEYHLGLTPDYQYLSHNGTYLGMTVFVESNRVIIYSPATQRAEYIYAKARTVIIDNSLLEENQEHRYRFTMGHECGHDIFHADYFVKNAHLMPSIQCRADSTKFCNRNTRTWDDSQWMEWQANCFSSALLMPATAVKCLCNRYHRFIAKQSLIEAVTETFNVSKEAAEIRLMDLDLISHKRPVVINPVMEIKQAGFILG